MKSPFRQVKRVYRLLNTARNEEASPESAQRAPGETKESSKNDSHFNLCVEIQEALSDNRDRLLQVFDVVTIKSQIIRTASPLEKQSRLNDDMLFWETNMSSCESKVEDFKVRDAPIAGLLRPSRHWSSFLTGTTMSHKIISTTAGLSNFDSPSTDPLERQSDHSQLWTEKILESVGAPNIMLAL